MTESTVTLRDILHTTKRIYVCGKMTGLPDYNYPKFNEVSAKLRQLGFEVENPAEIIGQPSWDWNDYMKEAIHKMMTCDTIFILDGYETSPGSLVEIELARRLNYTRVFEYEYQHLL